MNRGLPMAAAAVFALLAVINIWPADTARSLLDNQRARETHGALAETARLCAVHHQVEPLVRRLNGATVRVIGEVPPDLKARIANLIRQAHPDVSVFIDDVQERKLAGGSILFQRRSPPTDALIVAVSTTPLVRPPTRTNVRLAPDSFEEVVIRKPSGVQLGRWQGVIDQTVCGHAAPHGTYQTLTEFFAPRYGERVGSPIEPEASTLEVSAMPVSSSLVARPQDFDALATTPDCPARLLPADRQTREMLTVPTPNGTVWFTKLEKQRVMPAVACGAVYTAALFRLPDRVVVAGIDAQGSLLGSTSVPAPPQSDAEAFRDVRLEGATLRATLVGFAVDDAGVLRAREGLALTASLEPRERQARRASRPLVSQHTACVTPPPLDGQLPVWELNTYGDGQYLQRPGEAPRLFAHVVVDAPLHPLAVSLRAGPAPQVWLLHVTAGTDLRYVEVNDSRYAQEVFITGDEDTVVNVATSPNCPTLFSPASPQRRHHAPRDAAAFRGEHAPLALVKSGDMDPWGRQASLGELLVPFGYRHFATLGAYFETLEREGVLVRATDADLLRFDRYFYDALSWPRKLAWWLKADPQHDLRSSLSGTLLLVRGQLRLPEGPGYVAPDARYALLVERQVPPPSGWLAEFLIIDANSLGCPGRTMDCPWHQARAP